ncbi:MAG: hypothetical protein ACLR23_28330 [Clostridia bacterium]
MESGPVTPLSGSQVEILPGHCCTTANTFDWAK